MAEQTILCPSCGKRIPISKALTEQAEANLRKDFEAELRNARKQWKWPQKNVLPPKVLASKSKYEKKQNKNLMLTL
jgi:uncharacterized Zn finger protein (UPF0148 family)